MKVSAQLLLLNVQRKKIFVLPLKDSNNNALIHYLCDMRKLIEIS